MDKLGNIECAKCQSQYTNVVSASERETKVKCSDCGLVWTVRAVSV